MKLKVTAALLAGYLTIVGCENKPGVVTEKPRAKQAQPFQSAHAKDSLEYGLEREIRKHEKTLADLIEQDFTNKEQERNVTLRKESKKLKELVDQSSFLGHSAAYFTDDNILLFPVNGKDNAAVLDAVDHELWHMIFDELIEADTYKGPNKKQIASFVSMKLSTKEFTPYKTMVKNAADFFTFEHKMSAMVHALNFTKKEITRIITEYDTKELVKEKYISKEDNKKFKAQKEKIESNLEGLITEIETFIPVAIKVKNNMGPDPTLKESADIYATLKGGFEKMGRAYETLHDSIVAARKNVETIYYPAEDKQYQDSITKLKQEIKDTSDKEEKAILQKMIEIKERTRSLIKLKRSVEKMSILPISLMEILPNAGKHSVQQLLGPNEFMARVVDSLYSLHYDQVEQNKFPLHKQDLQFLSMFEYNGKQLFRKGIERYTVGQQMIADGADPATVKRKLEFATEFSYKGQNYSWPDADFVIKGTIPVFNKK